MHILRMFKEPQFRTDSAHVLVIIVLIVTALFITKDTTTRYIELFGAFFVYLHHRDSINIKRKLVASKMKSIENNKLFEKYLMVSETDKDGVITYVNDNYCQVTGYSKNELIGSTHAKIKDNRTFIKKYKSLWETIKKNETFSTILKNRKKDGTPFWIDTHIIPITINGTQHYRAIMFDITDKMLHEQELKNKIETQASKFEFAINSSRDGFWDYNLKSNDFYLSKKWKKRLGFTAKEEITYLDYNSLISDNKNSKEHINIQNLIENMEENSDSVHFRLTYHIVTKNGEQLTINDVGDIFVDKDKKPIRITGFHRDITEQERQAKIIESQNRLSAMGDMMSNITHQWRQPISAINNTLNDLEFDIELEDLEQIDSKTFLETSKKVKEYTTHMNQTINDFRGLTSDKKKKIAFIINYLIDEAYKIVQTEYEKNQIQFTTIYNPSLLVDTECYERELKQVLINLLNNAKDALVERKTSNPIVTINLINFENEIKIIIQDNAGGISDEIIEKIFDPYFTTKHESIGTGLGLNMSKKIITQYCKGTLEVKNKNNGAEFTITLPKV
ncbi:MAG: PAS domain-containing sensor histidine kinase [Campylobacterota bacterium]|nr:PAS domain-containing sensor histidine kinase [Campylobacterota bacterium]